MSKKKLLAVFPFLPYPPDFGGRIRSFHLLELLRRHFQIELAALTIPEDDSATINSLGGMVERLFAIPSPPSSPLSRRQKIKNTLLPQPWELPLRSGELERVVYERSLECDLVFLCSARLLHLRHCSRSRVHILDLPDIAHTIFSRRVKTTLGLKRRSGLILEFLKTLLYELKNVSRFDLVSVTSDRDAHRLYPWLRKLPLCVVPNGVDTERYSFNPLHYGRQQIILFLGALDYSPNVAAVDWLCRSILPKLKRSIPEVKLLLVGRNPPPLVHALVAPDIELAANVPDVRPYLRDSGVLVVPITTGGGTRIKILEAAAAGRPVVSTTVGAEGLNLVPGKEIEIADTEAEFVRKIVSILTDPTKAQTMTRLARLRVEREYEWEASRSKLEEAMSRWL